MTRWYGAVAAMGGLVALGEWFSAASPPLYATVGGLVALVFGIFAAYCD